jgi:hypothetical protein
MNIGGDYMVRKITNKELIENLKQLQKSLGHAPRKKDIQTSKGSKYGSSAYVRAFGNITNALLVANIKPHQIRGLKKETVIEDIKEVYKIIGRTPRHKEYKTYSKIAYSFPKIKEMFGSWTKALTEADIPVVNFSKVNKKMVLKELNRWYIKNNCDINCLSYWNIREAKKNGEFLLSCATIKNHIGGSWEEIMKNINPMYETKDPFVSRKYYIGNDNNEYLSLLELKIGNYLHNLKNLKRIKNYEYEKKICEDKLWTCDFVILLNSGKEIWIEADGMRNNRNIPYNSGYNKKIEYYKKNNFCYIIVSYKNRDVCKFIGKYI